MIIVMQQNADEAAIGRVIETIRAQGLMEHISRGKEHVIIGAVGDERVFDAVQIERLPQVEKAIRIVHDWRIISREAWAEDTVFTVRGMPFGGQVTQTMMALSGSLNEEDLPEQIHSVLLDPFYAPDNPYALSGCLKECEAIRQLQASIALLHGQKCVVAVRVRDSRHIQAALNAEADLVYLGGEMLANRALLQETGCLNIPAIVCKAAHHSVRDWLVAAEQIVLRGNQHVILGEAGTLNLHSAQLRLDVDAIAQARQLSHLPVLADISQLAHRYMTKETLIALAQAAGANIVVV